MRIARLDTIDGPQHAVCNGDAWEVVEDGFADPLVRAGTAVAVDQARFFAPCEPLVLIGIAHNKRNNAHPLPIRNAFDDEDIRG